MRPHLLFATGFLLLPALSASAAPDRADGPAFAVQTASLDVILGRVRDATKAFGKDAGEAFERELLGEFQQAGGRDAVDFKRKFGAYGDLAVNWASSRAVVLVPIVAEKKFLAFLE